jgi:hypothetical protein
LEIALIDLSARVFSDASKQIISRVHPPRVCKWKANKPYMFIAALECISGLTQSHAPLEHP